MKRIADLVDGGKLLNHAIREVVPPARRSWVIRHWADYRRDGFEALIDGRRPMERREDRKCGPLIEAARLANPRITVAEMLRNLSLLKVRALPSESTIKVHFARVDGRRGYAEKKKRVAEEVVELPFAGGELLVAAEVETGGIAALTAEVVALGQEALAASAGREPARDVELRSKRGQFTVGYNRKRRRKRGQEIASYLRTAAEKAEGRVPSWPRFVHERPETIDPKLRMLTFGWMVAGTKGWAALRAPDVAGLLPLTGFAYMPSTLAKICAALAVANAGPRLLQRLGTHWHQVAQERWGEAGAMAALYVDNHAKEVWSSLFTQSGKVAHLSRVMPCITTTYVHTGAGTPLVASVQSGSAPLAPRLVELVERAEAMLEGEVRRAVVIDAEGSTFDILQSFAERGRVIVTPLRPSRTPELKLSYTAGSYFRPYREHDELRVAKAILTHRSTGRRLELGALLVRREGRASDTVLLTTGTGLGMEGRDLADLYFARWPIQENAFKEGAAVGLDEHRGNCGRMVANVAVVTELERLERRVATDEEKLRQLEADQGGLESAAGQARHEHERAARTLLSRRRRLDALVLAGRTDGKQLGAAAVDHQQALVREETCASELARAQAAVEKCRALRGDLETGLATAAQRRTKLESQRVIRQLDVAQDMIHTATKLTAVQLIGFAQREYLPTMAMTPQTFVTRIFPIRGRREVRPDEELVVFYENPRDPEVNAAIEAGCRRLNQRRLQRNGRRLRYEMEPAEQHRDAPNGKFG
jgi:hypothetical protein